MTRPTSVKNTASDTVCSKCSTQVRWQTSQQAECKGARTLSADGAQHGNVLRAQPQRHDQRAAVNGASSAPAANVAAAACLQVVSVTVRVVRPPAVPLHSVGATCAGLHARHARSASGVLRRPTPRHHGAERRRQMHQVRRHQRRAALGAARAVVANEVRQTQHVQRVPARMTAHDLMAEYRARQSMWAPARVTVRVRQSAQLWARAPARYVPGLRREVPGRWGILARRRRCHSLLQNLRLQLAGARRHWSGGRRLTRGHVLQLLPSPCSTRPARPARPASVAGARPTEAAAHQVPTQFRSRRQHFPRPGRRPGRTRATTRLAAHTTRHHRHARARRSGPVGGTSGDASHAHVMPA